MPHIATRQVFVRNCLQPPEMSISQAKTAIYLQHLSRAYSIEIVEGACLREGVVITASQAFNVSDEGEIELEKYVSKCLG